MPIPPEIRLASPLEIAATNLVLICADRDMSAQDIRAGLAALQLIAREQDADPS